MSVMAATTKAGMAMTAITTRYPRSAYHACLRLPDPAQTHSGTNATKQAITSRVLRKVAIWR